MMWFRKLPINGLLVLLLVCSLSSFIYRSRYLKNEESSHGKINKRLQQNFSATSGSLFEGSVIRTFPDEKFQYEAASVKSLPNDNHEGRPALFSGKFNNGFQCSKWSVVTTIFKPSDAVQKQAMLSPEWCMVIVADLKTPIPYNISGLTSEQQKRVVFLPIEAQNEFGKRFKLFKSIPWNHFGRKNVGYLFAIAHGAELIWDFDDDNELISSDLNINGMTGQTVTIFNTNQKRFSTFNPYFLMGAPQFPSWPRGLPLQHIKEPSCYNYSFLNFENLIVPTSKIGVIQSLANHDPDVDALYRLTMPLPFDFQTSEKHPLPVSVPPETFTPLNAQATLWMKNAFWMLLLPITVHGRVSDIWRSYFGERILHELELKVLFHAPLVRQQRNAHNYLADFNSEEDLYLKSGALVDVLGNLHLTSVTIPGMIEQVWVEMYERGFVEIEDVVMVQDWVRALQEIGYQFPIPLSAKQKMLS